jgi:hypothetical protein
LAGNTGRGLESNELVVEIASGSLPRLQAGDDGACPPDTSIVTSRFRTLQVPLLNGVPTAWWGNKTRVCALDPWRNSWYVPVIGCSAAPAGEAEPSRPTVAIRGTTASVVNNLRRMIRTSTFVLEEILSGEELVFTANQRSSSWPHYPNRDDPHLMAGCSCHASLRPENQSVRPGACNLQ